MSNCDHYESFRDTLERLPPSGVLRFIEMERNMIELDFAGSRDDMSEEDVSILNFCRFLEAVVIGMNMAPCTARADHEAFYARIVQRMVEARELPPYAERHFDMVFPSGFSQQMAA